MRKILNWAFLILFLLPLGACVVHIAQTFPEKTERDRESQRRGDELVVAIEDYRAENGRLPGSLDELRTAREHDLPTPAHPQRDFSYEVSANDYTIEFLESSFGMFSADGYHRYRSESGVWDFYLP